MSEPLFVEPLFQKDSGDCAICCLVMLLGKTYPEVVRATPTVYCGKPWNCVKGGMTNRMMIQTAAKLGTALIQIRKFDLSEDTGILTVRDIKAHKDSDCHAVLLSKGLIIDPMDGRLWFDADDFLRVKKYRTGTLLRRL
jgi:hypothetical protein